MKNVDNNGNKTLVLSQGQVIKYEQQVKLFLEREASLESAVLGLINVVLGKC